jgi:hypothetical protein
MTTAQLSYAVVVHRFSVEPWTPLCRESGNQQLTSAQTVRTTMPRPLSQRFTSEDAETLALQALTFLVCEPQRLSRFLALTGMDVQAIRAAAVSADLQTAILEYLLSDESLLLTFCQERGIDPATIGPMHDLLFRQAR